MRTLKPGDLGLCGRKMRKLEFGRTGKVIVLQETGPPGIGIEFGAQVAPLTVSPLPRVTPPARPTCRPGYQGPGYPPHGFTVSATRLPNLPERLQVLAGGPAHSAA